MNRAELASLLASAGGDGGRRALLAAHPALADVALAYALKDLCLEAWNGGDPPRAVAAAAALEALSEVNDSEEVAAVRAWGAGIAALVEGGMEQAVRRLDRAAESFRSLCRPH
ncbi:MAG TPA: hypothetical protein VK422_10695, partial [Pyrinomonadaceae bacterium]|nr:hypothetical protein [Pyrinomonadaceae bacterium]